MPTPYTAEYDDANEFIGGTGNDRLVGGPGNDIIRGGPATMRSTAMAAMISSTAKAATTKSSAAQAARASSPVAKATTGWAKTFNFEAGAGAWDGGNETFNGEGGTSSVSFLRAPGPVNVKVDGAPDSGVPGQQDTIEGNISEVDGSEYNDTLTAGTTPVTLDGEGGNDTIYGGSGGDTLRGGGGDDTIHTVGPDGVGPDSIFASETFCNFEVSCPTGNTTIYANDGVADQISCAPGADIVYADAIDTVATGGVFNCPTVYRSSGNGSNPGNGTNPGGVIAGTSSFEGFKTKGNTASLKVACAGASTSACADTLTLSVVETLRSGKLIAVAAASKTKKKTVTIGHTAVTLGGGQSKTVSVALNSAGRALLKREHKLHAKLVLTQTSAGKTVAVKGQTLTFTAPKHH